MDYHEAFMNLQRIGIDYINIWLRDPDTHFECNAYDGFKDFIRFGFYRNRRDEVSEMYIRHAQAALEDIARPLSADPSNQVKLLAGKGKELTEKFESLVALDSKNKKKKKETHPTDRKFLTSACDDFIPKLSQDDYNVRHFCRRFLKNRKLKALHDHLTVVKGIGPKIASLYLRDMLLLYVDSLPLRERFVDELTIDQIKVVYPIDTWVEKISKKILDVEGDKSQIAEMLIEKCRNAGVSPIYVNHGIYQIGAKAQKLLLDNLDHLKEFRVNARAELSN